MRRMYFFPAMVITSLLSLYSTASSHVVQFRFETTDLTGTPVDTVMVGDDFWLNAYTQHVGGYGTPNNAGVRRLFGRPLRRPDIHGG